MLEHYLRGLRVGPASLRGLPDLDGDLRDMQFESAWRMSEWDPALSVGGSPKIPITFFPKGLLGDSLFFRTQAGRSCDVRVIFLAVGVFPFVFFDGIY